MASNNDVSNKLHFWNTYIHVVASYQYAIILKIISKMYFMYWFQKIFTWFAICLYMMQEPYVST